jgi:hypothetical protein
VKRFLSFLYETPIPAGAGTKGWQRSGAKYFDKQAPTDKKYRLTKPVHGLEAGTPVHVVSNPEEHEGVMHVKIKHPETGEQHSVPVSNLHKPIDATNRREKETAAGGHLSDLINNAKEKEGKGYVPMKLNGKIHHITGVKQIPGNPKADFALENEHGEHVYHISHKDGTKPTHHQGYLTSHNDISNTSTYKTFAGNLKKAVKNNPHGLQKNTVGANLDNSNPEHQHVIRTAVFGKNYGSEKSGVNNVDHVAQGQFKLKKHPQGHYELSSDHDIHKGDEMKQHYIMFARHASDRELGGTNIQGRVFVHAQGARKINTHVDV